MYQYKLTVTHDTTTTDITHDAVDVSFTHEQREIAEMTFEVLEPSIPQLKNNIAKEDTITAEINNTTFFTGTIKTFVPQHTLNGTSYSITARGTLVGLAKRTNGHRKYINKNIQEILSGWSGDAAWTQDIQTAGTISLVSTSADDTQNATIVGTYNTFIRNETVSLSGTSSVTSSNSYDGILSISLNSNAVGTITAQDSAANTIGTFSAGDSELCTSETDGTYTNYSNGLLYDSGFYANFSSTPDYDVQDITFHHEYMIVSLDRLCDIGDSNGVWDYTETSNIITFKPRTDYTNSYTVTKYETIKEEDTDSVVDRIILIGSKVQQSDGTWQEVMARATSGNGYEDMVVTDTDITDTTDAEQKASNILNEYSTTQTTYEIGPIPLNTDITINDRAYVRNPDTHTFEYKRIYGIDHNFSEKLSVLRCGSKRTIDKTINVISGYDGIAMYGSANIQDLDTRRKYIDTFEGNLSSSFGLTYNLDVQEEGIVKATLKIDGLKYKQYSAESHYHDNAASYTVDSHTHGVGTYGGDSHSHGDGTYDADNHDHNYGTLEDTSQTHSLYSNYGSFAYKSHDHDLSSEGGTDEVDGSDFPHSHSALTGSTDANTSGSNMYYLSSGSTQSAAADINSGDTGSEGADIAGSSGGSSVSVSGASGGRGASITGNSGSESAGAELKEDTYPSNVTLTINGTDRTTALGGSWSNNFSEELDITDYVNTEGTHSLVFGSDQNGRIRGKVIIYY
jgi:hypothetical protein